MSLRFLLIGTLTGSLQLFLYFSKSDIIAKWRESLEIIRTLNNLKLLAFNKYNKMLKFSRLS